MGQTWSQQTNNHYNNNKEIEVNNEITENSSLEEKEMYATQLFMEEYARRKRIEAEQLTDNTQPEKYNTDNDQYEYHFQPSPVPVDEEGYVEAFEVEQQEEIKAFFEKYGVVVVKNVLNKEEYEKTEEEIWDFLKRHSKDYLLDRNDPLTWHYYWPSLRHLGILGNTIILSPQICRNRQNPKIHKAFSILFGTDRLRVSVERASSMRPTRNVKFPDSSELRDMPEWRTKENWIHWDMNPWNGKTSTYSFFIDQEEANYGYDMLRVQGILAAKDCGPNDGGFHCVPGFHHHIRGWAHVNRDRFDPSQQDTTFQVPQNDPIRNHVQRMPIRAGSLLIWNSGLPHGNFPNESESGRMIQYIKMASLEDKAVKSWLPKKLLPPQVLPLKDLPIVAGDQ
eukprot:gb/GECH01000218.1/.p1 GENE.gb/GECH01000218.1/~~gb/GECH01000218.1/.p1  ORF type:complete len:394 (+),score=114.50 gb/GECH01000218.1/:1-1182(+)